MFKNSDLTTPVRPDDFIHIQVHQFITLLRVSENYKKLEGNTVKQQGKIKDHRVEEQHKERVIEELYKSTVQPFLSTEQQLGNFFLPIINKLVTFRDEVLVDFKIKEKE